MRPGPAGGGAEQAAGPAALLPWDELSRFAIGVLGMRPADMRAASFRELAGLARALAPAREPLARAGLDRLMARFPDA